MKQSADGANGSHHRVRCCRADWSPVIQRQLGSELRGALRPCAPVPYHAGISRKYHCQQFFRNGIAWPPQFELPGQRGRAGAAANHLARVPRPPAGLTGRTRTALRLHVKHFGDRGKAHRSGPRLRYPQNIAAATGRHPRVTWQSRSRSLRVLLGQTGNQRCVDAERTHLGRPPGDPRGSSRPLRVSVKNAALSA